MSKTHVYILLLIVALIISAKDCFSQKIQQKLPEHTRILFLLDASGSMLGKWERTNRITAAKKLLSDLVDSLKINENLELALRVYGHQYNKRLQNCKDTRLEVPFKVGNHNLIKNKLAAIQPKGTTPLAYSLEQAANDFTSRDNVRNIVIIITDGLESCDGDPCDVSLALQKKNVFLKPFIIGLGMNASFENEFSCLGQFFDATNIRKFKKVLNQAIQQTLNKTTVSVELLDHNGKPEITNVNVSFINNMTKEPVYDFVHYRDKNNQPDSVEIDAVPGYDLIVNTIPPVVKKNILIVPGKHNVLNVNAPQGAIKFTQPSHTEYKKGVKIVIKKSGKPGTVNVQDIGTKESYLIGNYDIEILTLPKINLKNIEIKPKDTREIKIPDPGVLNIYSSVNGYGSLYEIRKDGTQRWIQTLEENQNRFSMAIQPGNYKLVFRAENAFGSKYTTIKKFNIKSGSTLNIKSFDK